MFTVIADHAKSIGAVLTCCGGLYGGVAYFEAIPVTKSFVVAETRSLRTDMIEGRLETNDVRRQLLRKEKFDRTLELEKETQPNVKSILRERLEWLEGQLDEVNGQREELRRQQK